MTEPKPESVNYDQVMLDDMRNAIENAKPRAERALRVPKFIRPDPIGYHTALVDSRNSGQLTFSHVCPKHGQTIFCSLTGVCLTCYGEMKLHKVAERVIIRTLGGDRFMADCVEHGESPHRLKGESCVRCGGSSSPRALAVRAGNPVYVETCAKCGPADHSVRTGKCLICFTSAGLVRRLKPTNPRAVARKKGLKTYPDTCHIHGPSERYVSHGGCVKCFTSAGAKRSNAGPGRKKKT